MRKARLATGLLMGRNLLHMRTLRNSVLRMYAWRHLDRRGTARLLARLADPGRPPPRWLERLGLRPDFFWPFGF